MSESDGVSKCIGVLNKYIQPIEVIVDALVENEDDSNSEIYKRLSFLLNMLEKIREDMEY